MRRRNQTRNRNFYHEEREDHEVKKLKCNNSESFVSFVRFVVSNLFGPCVRLSGKNDE